MSTPDDAHVIVFNGEIYNFPGLRKEAEARGYTFITESDTEVILAMYRLYGAECVGRLRGMFAFALWDAKNQSLLLARDPIGIKPLYYAHCGGRLYFASEIHALLQVESIPREMDLEALDDYLTFLHTIPPRTFFKAIRELPPAHTAVWKDGRLSLQRYWRLHMEAETRTEGEWVEALEAQITETVRIHLISDVPVGAFLSGGLDSTTIVDAMARGRETPATFTIGFRDEGARYDETEDAAAIARHYGTDHHPLTVDAELASLLPQLTRHFGEPFANPMALLTYSLSEVVRKHIKVILSGDGGDECFGGYPRYQGLIAAQSYRAVPRPLRRVANGLVQFLPESTSGMHALRRIREFSAGSLLEPMDMYAYWLGYFTAEERAAVYRPDLSAHLRGRDSLDYIRGLAAESGGTDDVAKAMYIDAHCFLPHNVLRCNDRMSMAHGLEVRVPFADRKVFEFMARVPSDLKVRLRENKVLLRRYLRGRVPEEVLTRPKRGFAPPMGAWLAGPLRDTVEEYLSPESLRQGGYFEPVAVQAMRQAHATGKRDYTWHLWALIVFEYWRRTYCM